MMTRRLFGRAHETNMGNNAKNLTASERRRRTQAWLRAILQAVSGLGAVVLAGLGPKLTWAAALAGLMFVMLVKDEIMDAIAAGNRRTEVLIKAIEDRERAKPRSEDDSSH